MDNTILSVAIGAFFGALGPVIVVLIQLRHQRRMELQKALLEAAIHERSSFIDLAKTANRTADIHPLVSYLYYYNEVFKLIDKGSFTPEALREVNAKRDKFEEVV